MWTTCCPCCCSRAGPASPGDPESRCHWTLRRCSNRSQPSSRRGEIVARLLADPAYRAHLAARENRQVVMLGYSDSGKSAGIVASRWAIRAAHEAMARACSDAGVQLQIFHGRGGSISRGGGRDEALVRSQPVAAGREPCASPSRARASMIVMACGQSRCAASSRPSAPSRWPRPVSTSRSRWSRAGGRRWAFLRRRARPAIARWCTTTPPSSISFRPSRRWTSSSACRSARGRCLVPPAAASNRCGRFRGHSPGRRAGTCCPAGSGAAPHLRRPQRVSGPRYWAKCTQAGRSSSRWSTTSR